MYYRRFEDDLKKIIEIFVFYFFFYDRSFEFLSLPILVMIYLQMTSFGRTWYFFQFDTDFFFEIFQLLVKNVIIILSFSSLVENKIFRKLYIKLKFYFCQKNKNDHFKKIFFLWIKFSRFEIKFFTLSWISSLLSWSESESFPIHLSPRHLSIIYSRDFLGQLCPRHLSICLSNEFRTWRFPSSSRHTRKQKMKKISKFENRHEKKTCSASQNLQNIIFPRVRIRQK